jgi:hypothetical protein
MKFHWSLTLALLSLGTTSIQPAIAATPDADQILRTMSATLSAAPSLSFKATREIDAALLEDRQLPEKARVQVTVQRPDKFAATAHSASGTRLIVADGRTLSLLDAESNHYTTTPMPMSIDALVDQLDDKYGFTPPLAEFAVSNPYARFRSHARTVTYLGRGKSKGGFLGLGGVDCHRLQLTGPVATAELWVSVRDHLPRQLVATFHHHNQAQLKITFSEWNLAAPVNNRIFTFTPPKKSEKIEMWTTSQMDAASARSTKKNQ